MLSRISSLFLSALRSRRQPAVFSVLPAILFCVIVVVLFLGFYSPSSRAATTFTVNSLLDTGDATPDGACNDGAGNCTLREAIEEANALAGTDTITFDIPGAGPHIIQLASVLPTLIDSVDILNNSGESVTVRRNTGGNYSIFTVSFGVTVNISGLTITNGLSGIGGGIFNNNGTLTLTDSTVSGNSAVNDGGGIFNFLGTLTLTNSTVSGNSATSEGGGILNVDGTLTLTNSTVSGNSTDDVGGGIFNIGNNVTLTSVTVTDNRADSDNNGSGTGGGIFIVSGTPLLRSTIVADNYRGSGTATEDDISNGSANAASSFNLIGTGGSGGLTNGPNNNQVGVANPGLSGLANNGGPTQTHAISDTSPALDKGDDFSATNTTDQRGATRPFDFLSTSNAGDGSDIGAYELFIDTDGDGIGDDQDPDDDNDSVLDGNDVCSGTPASTAVNASGCPFFLVNSTDDDAASGSTSDGVCTTGQTVTVNSVSVPECTLRAAIQEANGTAGVQAIDFDPLVFTQPGAHIIQLGGPLPDLSSDMHINGPGARVLTVRRNTGGGYRIFQINSGQTVNISGLTITNGFSGSGGGIGSDGTLTLTNSTVSGNSGGGIFNQSATLTVTNSTISGNSGGGIFNFNSTLTMTNSTVSGNSGGGIFNFNSTLTLTNCTVSGNSTAAAGGGILSTGGTVTLTGVTVTDNHSDSDNNGIGTGGGINISGGTVLLGSTIVADNYRGSGTATEDDIIGTVDTASSSFNLIGTGGSGGLTNGPNNNQVGVTDPGLSGLANNGGQTDTHALSVTSPALDKGDDFSATPTTDQRGATRPVDVASVGNAGDGSDIGAYERQTSGPPAVNGQLIISEFRLHGPQGPTDEFIEIYNNTDSPHTVSPVSGSGYSVAASDGVVRCVIPETTIIPARGHFLCVNSDGYSLSGYPAGPSITATGDATYIANIPTNMGIALFRTSVPADFVLSNRLDAVGSSSETNAVYREGTGHAPITTLAVNYSFVRDECGKGGSITTFGPCSTFRPKDTNQNDVDFFFVDTTGTNVGAGIRLGAPGPENLSSPIQRNSTMPGVLLDNSTSASSPPNRVRNSTSDSANNSTFGTLEVRRRIVNNTGGPVTRLRFRVIDITTYFAPAGIADLRARSSTAISVAGINDAGTCAGGPPCTVTVEGTTLEQPPSQLNGGGFNSSLSVDTITLTNPLPPGASINVRFLLGVQQTGLFKFYVNIEALP